MIRFEDVYTDDPDLQDSYEHFLYLLLSEREKFVNISHKHLPTYANHCKFVRSKPYTRWYIIKQDSYPYGKVGAIYLSKSDEVGLFILKQYHGQRFGSQALKKFMSIIPERVIWANINPKNIKSIEFFTSRGFDFNHTVYDKNGKPIQNTYIAMNDVSA